MKLTVLFLTLASLFVGGTQLEARSYFSFNVGPVFSAPAYAPGYVVERYPAPAYVQQRTYVNPWGYPTYTESVVVRPAPVYRVVTPPPVFNFGFGWSSR